MKRGTLVLLSVILVAAFVATGCVSNQKFETAISDVESRVDDVQSGVEANSQEIDALESKTEEMGQSIEETKADAVSAKATGEQALEKAHAAAEAAQGKVIWKVTLTNRDVTFDIGKAEIKPSGASTLDQLVERLKGYDKMVFLEIQGHTDSTGSERFNEHLGVERAEAVRDYLHQQGIPLNLMSVISYGETRPVADNSTPEGRAANRRVEILVLE
jgi:outer membrane protein OmpA-like peptidoglycan-associated protein